MSDAPDHDAPRSPGASESVMCSVEWRRGAVEGAVSQDEETVQPDDSGPVEGPESDLEGEEVEPVAESQDNDWDGDSDADAFYDLVAVVSDSGAASEDSDSDQSCCEDSVIVQSPRSDPAGGDTAPAVATSCSSHSLTKSEQCVSPFMGGLASDGSPQQWGAVQQSGEFESSPASHHSPSPLSDCNHSCQNVYRHRRSSNCAPSLPPDCDPVASTSSQPLSSDDLIPTKEHNINTNAASNSRDVTILSSDIDVTLPPDLTAVTLNPAENDVTSFNDDNEITSVSSAYDMTLLCDKSDVKLGAANGDVTSAPGDTEVFTVANNSDSNILLHNVTVSCTPDRDVTAPLETSDSSMVDAASDVTDVQTVSSHSGEVTVPSKTSVETSDVIAVVENAGLVTCVSDVTAATETGEVTVVSESGDVRGVWDSSNVMEVGEAGDVIETVQLRDVMAAVDAKGVTTVTNSDEVTGLTANGEVAAAEKSVDVTDDCDYVTGGPADAAALEPVAGAAQPVSRASDHTQPGRVVTSSGDSTSQTTSQHIEKKLRNFTVIGENEWRQQQKLSRQQKEVRHMVCDCSLSAEELARDERGCGDDCLNRLLMIECGSRCPLGDNCSNKRFVRRDYYATSVFKTEMKGYGLRAECDMPAGAFIYEYVGEVLDAREFRRRTKQYDRLKYHHHYFMALSADLVIDATEKGNHSRFINHSCDPNAETQKWTVNGKLRIGFFTRRAVSQGEELTFDYQLQRYGREAQRCYCQSAVCRGWITARNDDALTDTDDQDDDDEGEDEEEEESSDEADSEQTDTRPSGRRGKSDSAETRRKDRALRRQTAERRELENDIRKLMRSGLKSKQHTLQLCRLMVRAEEDSSRLSLLNLIRNADPPCRRLFLDYHGLSLLWSWMTIGPSSPGAGPAQVGAFRRELLETLAALPVPNRSVLTDSRVLTTVERWATRHTSDDEQQVALMSKDLLELWSSLKEVFRIPKKERIQIMREHEKEADRGYQTYLQQHKRPLAAAAHKKVYDCPSDRSRAKRSRSQPGPPAGAAVGPSDPQEAKRQRTGASCAAGSTEPQLSKEERRRRFMLQVQRQEQQRQQRQQQLQLWAGHQQRCQLLGLDPHLTPIFDPSYQYYWEPGSASWQQYTPGDPAVPLVAAAGVSADRIAALPHHLTVFQSMAATDPAQAQLYLEQVAEQHQLLEQQQQQQQQSEQEQQQQQAELQSEQSEHQQQEQSEQTTTVVEDDERSTEDTPEEGMGLMELIKSQLPGKFITDDGKELSLLIAATAAAFDDFSSSYCTPAAATPGSDEACSQSDCEPDPGYQLASYTDPVQPNVTITNVPVPNGRSANPAVPPPPPPELVIKLPPDWHLTRDTDGRFYYYHQVTRVSQWEPPVFPDSTTPHDPPLSTVEETLTTRSSSSSSSSSSSGSSSGGGGGACQQQSRAHTAADHDSTLLCSPLSFSDDDLDTKSHRRSANSNTADVDDLEEGEIREDIAKDEEIDRRRMVDIRRRRKKHKRRSALVQEHIISPLHEDTDRRQLREERRHQRRRALLERRRERHLERLLQKHRSEQRRLQQSSSSAATTPSAAPANGCPQSAHTSPPDSSEKTITTSSPLQSALSSVTASSPESQTLSASAQQPTPEPQPVPTNTEQDCTPEPQLQLADAQQGTTPEPPVSTASVHSEDSGNRDEAIQRFKMRERILSRAKQRDRAKLRQSSRSYLACKLRKRARAHRSEARGRRVGVVRNHKRKSQHQVLAQRRARPPAAAAGKGHQEAASGGEGDSEAKPRHSRHKQERSSSQDTSSDKKIKDRFLAHMSLVVVSALNPFRKSDCKQGRITCTEDFKYLAKKLTHHVLIKELKSVLHVRDLQVNDSVKHKAKYYVKKYMNRLGPRFVRESGAPGEATALDRDHDLEMED